MKFYCHTEAGGHLNNEDSICVAEYLIDNSALICALADGQGGQAGGAQASQHAVSVCIEEAQHIKSLIELLNPFTWERIGKAVDKSVQSYKDAGYTTFIGLALINSFVIGISSGDSAVALVLEDKFVLLTEHQYKNPPIGSGVARMIPFSAKLNEYWKLLLMSDGVWKYAGWDLIINQCHSKNGDNLISSLLESASASTGNLLDDFSVILIEP